MVFPKVLEQNEKNVPYCLASTAPRLILHHPLIRAPPSWQFSPLSPALSSEIAAQEPMSAFLRIPPNSLQLFASYVVMLYSTSLVVRSDFADSTLAPICPQTPGFLSGWLGSHTQEVLGSGIVIISPKDDFSYTQHCLLIKKRNGMKDHIVRTILHYSHGSRRRDYAIG